MKSIGKISRLSPQTREQLNLRIENDQPAKLILDWLNTLPETQSIIAAEFEGRSITKQNLSEWKQGGYRDWQAQQEALEVAARLGEDAAEWAREDHAPLIQNQQSHPLE